MTKRKIFTEKERELICSMYQQGYTATQICKIVQSLNDRKPQTLYPVLIKAGLYKKKPANDLRKYIVDDNYFDSIDTEHKAYWLGFLIADGFLTNSGHAKETFGISLKSTDGYMLNVFKQDLKSNYPIHEYTQRCIINNSVHYTTYNRLLIKSKKIFYRLKELGLNEIKSYTAKLPLSNIPTDLTHHLIRGYFDGDGSFAKSGEKKYHTYDMKFTGTYEVIVAIRSYFNKDNLKLQQRYPNRDNNNYSLNICGDKQVYNLGKLLYKDATIYLQRKHERLLELQKKYE